MIMTNKEKDTVALYCSCGLDEGVLLKVDKYDNDIDGIEISLVSDIFYLNHYAKINHFKEKLKRIRNILKGEERYYFNIYVDAEDIKEFKEFVAQI